MKTHGLTIKLIAKKPKNVRNCESRVRNARPLVAVLPEDIVIRATLIASALCAGTEGDPEGS